MAGPEQVLEAFARAHGQGPRQRSAEWHRRRRSAVGGSELAAVIGWSCYSKPRDIARRKAGFDSFRGNTACRWGTLLEPVTERVVELDCRTRLWGTSIHIDGALHGYPGYANSPDGYCMMPLVRREGELRVAEAEDCGRAGRLPVLLELKAPFTRTPRGEVPRHYLPQVWSGLELSPPALLGVFVDALYRFCGLEDLGPSPAYNQEFHWLRGGCHVGAYAWGLICLRAPDGAVSFANKAGLPADLGGAAPADIERALEMVERGELAPYYDEPQGLAASGPSESDPPGSEIVCYLGWKLFRLDYVPVPRRPGFLRQHHAAVLTVLRQAKQLQADGDKPEPPDAHTQALFDLGLAGAANGCRPAAKRPAAKRPPDARTQALFDLGAAR